MSDIVPAELKAKLFSEGKFLVSKIDAETIESIQEWILRNRLQDDPKTEFTLVINSSGGDPGLVTYFASFLRTLSDEVKLKGVAYGECGSAALALLQCCHERIAVKHCGFFIHHISDTLTISCHNLDMAKVRHVVETSKKLEDELVELQAERCGMSKQRWKTLADKGEKTPGSAILPKEAEQLGMIDKIIEKYPLF